MENRSLIYLVFAISLISFIAINGLVSAFVGFSQPQNASWYNTTWRYRIKLEINSTIFARTDWPIEHVINFTDQLPSGTFDINSVRVFEYNRTGGLIFEVPSQFDTDVDYNSLTNAIGTIVFIMNGTTQINSTRTYFVYYDILENGAKSAPSYGTNMTYNWTGQALTINTTFLNIIIDTNRGENTSGISFVREKLFDNVVLNSIAGARTAEYLEYSNGTTTFGFDLRNNLTLKIGPVRITAEQTGYEILFGNVSARTNETILSKKYYFYNRAGVQDKGSFIKLYHSITNNASSNILRNSTHVGAVAIDVNRTLNSGSTDTEASNKTDPYSWAWASGAGGEIAGIVNLNETNTYNYSAVNRTIKGRIGIELNATTMAPNASISQTSLLYFGSGGSDAVTEFLNIKNAFATPVSITQTLPESWFLVIRPSMNIITFNRNETITIKSNISSTDPYNLTVFMNATLDLGTVSTADDITIALFDDGTNGDTNAGDKVFTNSFNISTNAITGPWQINLTSKNNNSQLLNSTLYFLNVTSVYNVTLNISNPVGLVGRVVFANVTVKNYRLDTNILGAVLNCSFGSTAVNNITDNDNGNYTLNFTAPASIGNFDLFCNATMGGNAGNDTKTFFTQTTITNFTIVTDKNFINITNISLYNSSTFSILANATNYGSGTGYNSNFTLELLSGWSGQSSPSGCGDILNQTWCFRNFNITIPNNTVPGNYSFNITFVWVNPDATYGTNKTTINVTVFSNPQINVSESNISITAADGTMTNIGTFNIFSIGNSALNNVTFNCFAGIACQNFTVSFLPTNISDISVNQNRSVSINVTVPVGFSPGSWNGTVNISSGNIYDLLDIQVILPPTTNISTSINPTNPTVSDIIISTNSSFTFILNITNIANSSARNTNATFNMISGWSSNYTLVSCNNITRGASCTHNITVFVPNGTLAANYSMNVSVTWTNLNNTQSTNITSFNVTILPNPLLNISVSSVATTISPGLSNITSNFTVLSIGNSPVQNVNFTCISGTVCNNFTLVFTPNTISSIAVGSNNSVSINVTVPANFTAGDYTGIIVVNTSAGGSATLQLNVTVRSNRIWTLSPSSCQRSESVNEGTVCDITVLNLGNDIINFTIIPIVQNKTSTNITDFNVGAGLNTSFRVLFNITGFPQTTYNSTYVVSAVQNSTPVNLSFNITLLPFLPPIIVVSVIPNSTQQNNITQIYLNVTDAASSGISYVIINITRPNGAVDTLSMNKTSESGNFTQWYLLYPNGTLGNTTQRGRYSFIVHSSDNIGNIANATGNFTVFINMTVTSTTLSSSYLQGDTGSIFYSARNITNGGISDINVTFKIFDPNNNVTFQTSKITDSEGSITPLPAFMLADDAVVGNYSLNINSTYFDIIANRTVELIKNSTFSVTSKTVTVSGLFADIETAVVWFPSNVMRFGFLIYDAAGAPVDPTFMNFTVYDPAGNLYFTTNISSMTKQTTGFYTYNYAMSAGTATGMYLGVLNVIQNSLTTTKLKAFRVASGGPYDVRLQLLENEVPAGTYLDYIIFIENKGEVTQDVFVDYWISQGSTVYYNASEAVLTPAFTNQSFTRNAFIFSSQIPGTYQLNARVLYDNVQPAINVTSTFVVLSASSSTTTTTTTTSSSGGGGGGSLPTTGLIGLTEKPDKISSLLIYNYNNNITLSPGFERVESVSVINDGQTAVNNITLLVLGIPTSWFAVKPESYKTLEPGNSSTFLVNYKIPDDANPGEYKANLLVLGGTTSDQKSIMISLLQSVQELLMEEIQKLRRELDELMIKIEGARKEGKYVNDILILTDEADKNLDRAEANVTLNNTSDATENIDNARNLIKNARDALSKIEIISPQSFGLPVWILATIAVSGIMGVSSTIVLWKKNKVHPSKLRPHVISMVNIIRKAAKGKPVDSNSLEKDKYKYMRMLKVLEKEKEEGLMSSNAYAEMKKSIEEKLSKVDKKIKK